MILVITGSYFGLFLMKNKFIISIIKYFSNSVENAFLITAIKNFL